MFLTLPVPVVPTIDPASSVSPLSLWFEFLLGVESPELSQMNCVEIILVGILSLRPHNQAGAPVRLKCFGFASNRFVFIWAPHPFLILPVLLC